MKTSLRAVAQCLLPITLLVGCASGYQRFYTPAQGITPEAVAAVRVNPAPAMPIIERAQPTDTALVLDAYAKRGYMMIGSSMFNSGRTEPEGAAVRQAQEIGADLVLILNPQYTGSITTHMPLTNPTMTTSFSTGSATAYGPGGSVSVYGNSQTTTFGTETTYIPMVVHRADYGAVFFVKRRVVLGAYARGLSDAERQDLQTNKGVVVSGIVDNTPAFSADILVGDLITAIDNQIVLNGTSFADLLQQQQGKKVRISIVRKGQRITKLVQLNP